jgi:putative two-component system response regulator
MEARITTIADVFDALLNVRPYKEAFSYDKTREIMVNESGCSFQPELMDILVKHYDRMVAIHKKWL